MALVDSLLTAMVRADGDALVMHVGERPYVVTSGGTLDLSTQSLNLDAMTGMLQQLLPTGAQDSLVEFGAVEHRLPPHDNDTFTVVAARGGDDIWIEIRRRRHAIEAAVAAPIAAPPPAPEEAPVTMADDAAPAPEAAPPIEEPLPVGEPTPVVAEPPPVVEEPIAVLVDELPPVEESRVNEPQPLEETPPVSVELSTVDSHGSVEEPISAQAAEPSLPAAADVATVSPAPAAAAPAMPAALEATEATEASEALNTPESPDRARVLQMTRTVRIEVPPRVTPARGSRLERLLRLAASRAASALLVISDTRPSIRVEGELRTLDGEAAMTRTEVESALMEIVPDASREAVGRGEAAEWVADFSEIGRVRCITFVDHRGPGVVFRMIATRAATAEQLGLSREVQAMATEPQGLVMVTGRPGSGKSTLVSALVDLVNRQRAEYIITLERQVRLVHDNHAAIVSQREVRGGAEEALTAARAALREDPDVLVVDDLSSGPMVPLLLQAAAEGLVFVSITAPSTVDAVERFVDLAPADLRAGVRAAMADTFRGAVAQVLLKKSGGGRVAAREVLLATAAVTRVISDGTSGQLQLALDSGRRHGMVPLFDAVSGLVQSGVVDVREAFRKSPDRGQLLAGLKREGVDTSLVERLA